METRETVPLVAPDLSQFARALGRSLKDHHAAGAEPPGHVELMNLLARAAGHRNLQALRAAALKPLPAPAASPDDAPVALPLGATAHKALAQFDARGRLVRWPHKFSVQRLAMWALWTRFDSRRAYTEREVNEILKAWHTYGDHATLRRVREPQADGVQERLFRVPEAARAPRQGGALVPARLAACDGPVQPS